MNAVRLIQKIGQVPLSTLVEDAAKQGFVLVGSPTMISHVPAQLMVHVGVESTNPEYRIVEKTGQVKLSHQVAELMDAGWHIYGSLISGDVPMQAMVRGDIGVHKLFGLNGDGPINTEDWAKAIAKARDDAIAECKQYTDDLLEKLSETVTQTAELGANELASLTEAFVEEKQIHRDGIMLQTKKNQRTDEAISDVHAELQMEAEERRTDVNRLEMMILELYKDRGVEPPVAPAAARIAEPVATEYPPIVPPGSVWK